MLYGTGDDVAAAWEAGRASAMAELEAAREDKERLDWLARIFNRFGDSRRVTGITAKIDIDGDCGYISRKVFREIVDAARRKS